MTQIIYKYVLDMEIEIEIPLNAEILCVQMQKEVCVMCAKLDKDEDKTELRNFKIHGTGHDIDESEFNYEYIDTVQEYGGTLIWHVFERFPKVTAENVKLVREALDLSMNEAKSLLEEHKGNVKSVFSKFGINYTFKEFQKTREKDNIPFEILGNDIAQEGYLYLDKQCAIILLPNFEYELIIGNMDYVSTNLEELEMKLYKWAMSEGF